MKPLQVLVYMVVACALTACPIVFSDKGGKFQENPINLEKFNSEFDDYNSALPMNKYGSDNIIFSSKREKKAVFNLVIMPFELEYDDRTNTLNATNIRRGIMDIDKDNNYFNTLLITVNKDCNILGPNLISFARQIYNIGSANYEGKYILLYADDSAGHLQIKFVHNFNDKDKIEGPFAVSWLNSTADDAYPTFDKDFTKLYFCSDRDGNFDIFEVELPTDRTKLLTTLLSTTPQKVIKNIALSSSADDKCPYIVPSWWNETMYLVSNKTGGKGGFDIYYSVYKNGQWTTPENMGSRINTAYDEYRPIVPLLYNFNYHLGIFSSNKPSGKGGFDLYMAGFLDENATK